MLVLPPSPWPTLASGKSLQGEFAHLCDWTLSDFHSSFAEKVLRAAKGEKGLVEPSYVYLPGVPGGDAIAKATGVDFFSVPVELGVSSSCSPVILESLLTHIYTAQRCREGTEPSGGSDREGAGSPQGCYRGPHHQHLQGRHICPQPSPKVNRLLPLPDVTLVSTVAGEQDIHLRVPIASALGLINNYQGRVADRFSFFPLGCNLIIGRCLPWSISPTDPDFDTNRSTEQNVSEMPVRIGLCQ